MRYKPISKPDDEHTRLDSGESTRRTANPPGNIVICSCEDTMPLDAEAVRRGCRGSVSTAEHLCRAEIERFRTAAAQQGLLQIVRENFPLVEIIMTAAEPDVDGAVRAIKLGAYHFLTKDADPDVLREFVRQQNFEIRSAVEISPGALDLALVLCIASIELAQKFTALLGFEAEIKTRLALEQQLFAPCSVLIGPGFDGEQIAAGLGRREAAVPTIVAREPHRGAQPIRLGLFPPQEFRG